MKRAKEILARVVLIWTTIGWLSGELFLLDDDVDRLIEEHPNGSVAEYLFGGVLLGAEWSLGGVFTLIRGLKSVMSRKEERA